MQEAAATRETATLWVSLSISTNENNKDGKKEKGGGRNTAGRVKNASPKKVKNGIEEGGG